MLLIAATRAVNPGVVRSNPRSANILLDAWQKSLWQASSTNGLTVYVEKQQVTWKECCVEYWFEKARKNMSRWSDRRDMTEESLKTALNPNKSGVLLYFQKKHIVLFNTNSVDYSETVCEIIIIWVFNVRRFLNTLNRLLYISTGLTGRGILSEANGVKFSTLDIDNDNERIIDWSERHGYGGWWYDNCGYLIPEGIYMTPGTFNDKSMHDKGILGNQSLKNLTYMFKRRV